MSSLPQVATLTLASPKIIKKLGRCIAITHVANKMMTIIWHMLTTKTQYVQQNTKLYQKKLKKIDKIPSN
ncbi:MAG: hypothetical protein QXX85_08410 [Candidatus Nitrosotenuis sp.]